MSDEQASGDPAGETAGGGPAAGDGATDEPAAGGVVADGGETARVPVEEVHHVAELARVDVSDEEAEQFASQFADILSSFEALDEVPETDRDAELSNVMRVDEVREGLDHDEALANAPETEEGYFKGPRVS